MTEAEFRKLLRDLTTASQARHTARFGPRDDWLATVLRFGPEHQARRRRYLHRQMWIIAATILLATVLPMAPLLAHSPWPDPAGYAALLLLQIAPYVALPFALLGAPATLAPLLQRLDDVRLVPLWLEALSDCAPGQRPPLHAHLTLHLPRYTEPLPIHAQKALLNEVRRLSRKRRNDDENAFLIAALVSLETVDTPGVKALNSLVEQPNEHLKAAAEDALLRVRR